MSIAIIYCRVSSPRQVKEGHGLASQESVCREYAWTKGYDVARVFRDGGTSGKKADRSGMNALLAYLQQRPEKEIIVIIDDISRLARSLQTHIELRIRINNAGGKLESPSLAFGSDSDSQLIENLLASVSQHQRQKNAEQVKSRMRARLMAGYWVWLPPCGYEYRSKPKQGRILVRKEPLASILSKAFENFAEGLLASITEVIEFLEIYDEFLRLSDGSISRARVIDIFRNPLYAGCIHSPRWGVHMLEGQHDQIVSLDVWEKVQARLVSRVRKQKRVSHIGDFPLRGFVCCALCGHSMTASWSQGRKKVYGYYYCQKKDCNAFRKGIRKEHLERDFEAILKSKIASEDKIKKLERTIRKKLNAEQLDVRKIFARQQKEANKIERKISRLADLIIDATSSELTRIYEAKLTSLQMRKRTLLEESLCLMKSEESLDETTQEILESLQNPEKLWELDHQEDCRNLLRLLFNKPPKYAKNSGFGTAVTN